jgi:hypothetical protein
MGITCSGLTSLVKRWPGTVPPASLVFFAMPRVFPRANFGSRVIGDMVRPCFRPLPFPPTRLPCPQHSPSSAPPGRSSLLMRKLTLPRWLHSARQPCPCPHSLIDLVNAVGCSCEAAAISSINFPISRKLLCCGVACGVRDLDLNVYEPTQASVDWSPVSVTDCVNWTLEPSGGGRSHRVRRTHHS